MRRADEKETEIAKKSAISGFAVASVLLIVFILYDLVVSVHSSQLLIVLGTSQIAYWNSRIYYERVV